jgi:antitoxin component YwqK of YwqJK toxin-antitoxin module
MKTCIRFCIALLISIFFHSQVHSQGSDPKFYDMISNDSLMLYFNDLHEFVERQCANNVRYTRLTVNGDFSGFFEDRELVNDKVMMKGHYLEGKKHGKFEEYFPNGKTKSRGQYKDDKPFGIWEYFYENGLPERTLNITEIDTLVTRQLGKDGNLKVENGNGEFEALVQGGQPGRSSIVAKGKIVNGKPHGEWTSLDAGKMFAIELFEHGRFIKGSFPAAKRYKDYQHTSFLKTFFLPNYLIKLERLELQTCSTNVVNTEAVTSTQQSGGKFKFNMNRFSSELRSRVDKLIKDDFKGGGNSNYQTINLVTIHFLINEEGKPYNYRLLSRFGDRFYATIISEIREHAVFSPDTKEMYFHLSLNFAGEFTYKYGFLFSKDREYTQY